MIGVLKPVPLGSSQSVCVESVKFAITTKRFIHDYLVALVVDLAELVEYLIHGMR